ncbi:MAG TPA: ABC transporter permease subunit [Candidatus Saccharimonadales bacterium]|nr:ABC transporter permease subunit [Candidatus Saccharimonadales bacterium]
MSSALLGRLLRHNARILILLAGGLATIEILLTRLGQQLESSGGLREALLRMIPPQVQSLFGPQIELLTFNGAVAFGFQHPALLAASVGTVVAAATTPAAERESGLMDLILSGPVPRARYLAATLALVLIEAVLFPAALLGGAAAGLSFVKVASPLPWTRFIPAAAGMCALLLCTGGIALWIGVTARRRGQAVARCAALLLPLYIVEMLGQVWPALGRFAPLSPFHYYQPVRTVLLEGSQAADLAVLIGLAAITAAIAFVVFRRRDA